MFSLTNIREGNMFHYVVILCLLNYASSGIMLDKMNSIIFEHVLDLLDDVSEHLNIQMQSSKMSFGSSKFFCPTKLKDKLRYCNEQCTDLPMLGRVTCKTQNFASYLGGCSSGTMECHTDTSVDMKCGFETTDSIRVVNGEPVNDVHKFSWQVGLSLRDNPAYGVSCGGSIITSKHILTAAHCFPDKSINNEKKYFVGIGSKKQHDTSLIIRQKKVFVHPYYRFPNHDIAIIELSYKINLEMNKISPICLPKDSSNDFTGLYATVSGWGSTVGYNPDEEPEPQYPNILQAVQIPVLSNSECQKHVSDLSKGNLCAGGMVGFENGGKDSCQGDSGGPLYVQLQKKKPYQQIGIVSYGAGCASKGNPGVYTRVTEYLDWIKETVWPYNVYII